MTVNLTLPQTSGSHSRDLLQKEVVDPEPKKEGEHCPCVIFLLKSFTSRTQHL